jgi:hypothetical protein
MVSREGPWPCWLIKRKVPSKREGVFKGESLYSFFPFGSGIPPISGRGVQIRGDKFSSSFF